jgi:alpha-D-ribose 1-methylphosphonate 5-triphosphate synthase subunit PhnI
MGYVAVTGGIEAIENAEKLSDYFRLKGQSIPIDVMQIKDQMRHLVDRVMGEGGLYSPLHAAIAIKQAEGDPLEASFYLRAYRSTLERLPDSLPISMDNIRITRRISSAFKDIPGGQILGATPDYRQRMLNFDLIYEDENTMREFLNEYNLNMDDSDKGEMSFKKVTDILREQGLMKKISEIKKEQPIDITKNPVNFPAPRSARLQMMARAETGGLLALAYSSMRGYGSIHPTIAELRQGFVEIEIVHPYRKNERITIGSIQITEAEIIAKFDNENEGQPQFTFGYGICFGCNEVKAISMAVLDRTMKEKDITTPAQNDEFVLMHTDGIESSGFCSHFKLPHYITFQSELDRVRTSQNIKSKKEVT